MGTLATNYGESKFIGDRLIGWQLGYFILTIFTLPLIPLFHFLILDPQHDGELLRNELGDGEFNRVFHGVTLIGVSHSLGFEDLKRLFSSKTFIALVFQGMTGAFPW